MACYKVDGKDFKNVQGIIYISHIVLLYDFESTSRMDYFYGVFCAFVNFGDEWFIWLSTKDSPLSNKSINQYIIFV